MIEAVQAVLAESAAQGEGKESTTVRVSLLPDRASLSAFPSLTSETLVIVAHSRNLPAYNVEKQ